MCLVRKTKHSCGHIMDEPEYCQPVQYRIDRGARSGSYTPCTIVPVPEPTVSRLKCAKCHGSWMHHRKLEWESMWANSEARTRGFPEAEARVARLKELDSTELTINLLRWKADTIRGSGPSIYDIYPQFIQEKTREMDRFISKWIADEQSGARQTQANETTTNEPRDTGKAEGTLPRWRRWRCWQ